MNDTDVSIDEQIHAFAASVRRHLDDLPADELDDILDGLTADLAEQAADNDGILDVGDPANYAEELRSAAGFPPRGEAVKRPPVRERFATWRSGVGDGIRRSAFGAWMLDLLVSLRPVWWVLRGFVVFGLIKGLVAILPPWVYGPQSNWASPSSPLEWLLLIGIVIVSVQWGRDRWLPKSALRHLRTVISILAVIVLPFALVSAFTPRVEYIDDGGYMPQGLMLDGVQINNIFAYDAEGNPIERVQLFTGKGTPIDLYGDGGWGTHPGDDGTDIEYGTHDNGLYATIPMRDYRGQSLWNIYPLDEARIDLNTGLPKISTSKRPEPPFLRAPDLDATDPSPSPTPGSPSPQPSPTPTAQ